MKQIRLFLYAAISTLAVASCAKETELAEPEAITSGEKTLLTLSLGSAETKTALVGGKTTWSAGDKVRIYNATGTFFQDVEVPTAATGLAKVELEVSMRDSAYYAVYPISAANGVSVNKVNIKLPSNPDGMFASANVCVGKTTSGEVKMRNVTAVLKINITSGNVIEFLQINAKNQMTGSCSVNLSGSDPEVTVTEGLTSATLAVGGIDGDYYIPVIPGTYAKDFSVTALRGNGGYQTITSTNANEVAINTIVSLGTIGDNLSKGLSGEGTEASPYIISNDGEYGAFVASVNLGNAYNGKVISLTADIESAKTPVGYYLEGEADFYFEGTFLGNNHTVNLDIDGANAANCKSPSYVGMFGQITTPASIKDVKVSGTVTSNGDYVAGLVGFISGDSKSPLSISGCQSSAKVNGNHYVGGLIGYADNVALSNCSNSGAVTGSRSVGGVLGYVYGGSLETVSNTGIITGTAECGGIYQNKVTTWNSAYWYNWETKKETTINDSLNGIGGLIGYGQNTSLKQSRNEGTVSGVTKVGGILGGAYSCSSEESVNSGAINASSKFAGGIAGWVYTSITSTKDTNNGAITAGSVVGGLFGFINAVGYSSSNAVSNINNATNNGAVSSTSKFSMQVASDTQSDYSMAGGIIGLMGHNSSVANNASSRRGIIHILNSSNTGDITGVGYGVGGLVGLAWSWFQYSTMSTIQNSSNSGKITGYCRLGGILGEQFDRWIGHGTLTLRNLVNKGDVVATIPTGTSSVAGIVGRSHYHSTSTAITAGAYGTKLENCLNMGKISYDADDNAGPYAGGIGGYFGRGYIKNCVNVAFVGPKSGNKPIEEALGTVGGIAGQLGTTYTPVSFSYWSNKTATNAFGTTSKSNSIEKALSFDENNQLSEVVRIDNKEYDIATDALNAWVDANSTSDIKYVKWKTGNNGPEFAQ